MENKEPRVALIPTFNENVENISNLPDEPREENGWPTDKLKSEFDKAAVELKHYLNTMLVPALIAARLPFRPTSVIPAANIQAAIEYLQNQISDAVAGTIPNGAITAEKLSQDLFKRVWGGLPWVSLDPPADSYDDRWPVGQVWITPEFTITNKMEYEPYKWMTPNSYVSVSGNDITIDGIGQSAVSSASVILKDFGKQGDRGYILFTLADVDPEITSLTMILNREEPGQKIKAGEVVAVSKIAFEQFGIEFRATWPTASLAKGGFTLKSPTVVNVDEILRQFPGINDMQNWGAYIRSIMPFHTHHAEFSGWVQAAEGQWDKEVFGTLPLSRGGTGRTSYAPGQMLYVGEDGTLNPIEKPSAPALLEMGMGGVPEWREKTKLTEELGLLRIKTGTYQGTGQERTIELPVTPKLLYIQCDEGPIQSGSGSPLDNPFVLGDGGERIETARGYIDGGSAAYTVNASLKKNGLSFSHGPTFTDNPQTYLGNRQSCNYTWLALY